MTDTDLGSPRSLHPRVLAKRAAIVEVCQRLGVRRLELFGSAATGAFDSFTSDYDFLVTWDAGNGRLPWLKRQQALQDELRWVMGRPVDLVEDRLVRPAYRPSVDASRVTIFDASQDA